MIEFSSPKLLLTVEEAAQELSLGRSHLYEQMRQGTIRSVRIGRSRRIRRSDLETFVAGLGGEEEPAQMKLR